MQSSVCNLVLCVVGGIIFASACVEAKPADYIKSCHRTSGECLKESLQATIPGFTKGDPGLNIDVLDPFVVNNLNLTLPGNLFINFNDGVATGFRKCIVDKARMIKDILEVQFHCNLTIKGKYSSSGRLLMFPIDGNGDATIKCKNIKFTAFFKLGSKVVNTQKYLEIKGVKVNHKFEGYVSYQMTNLFKGSPEMSKLVLQFMNRNWRMVAEEFGKPIVDFGVSAIMKNIKQLLKNVPENELVSAPMNL